LLTEGRIAAGARKVLFAHQFAHETSLIGNKNPA
jgi:hypothetical protein